MTFHDREALTLTHIYEFKGQDIGRDEGMPLRMLTPRELYQRASSGGRS